MLKYLAALALLTVHLCPAADGTAASYARELGETGLDPDECYRVRDLAFQKEDLKFYLTEGHLIFSKAVAGHRFAAVFTTDVPGGDAELLVFPPHKSERQSLASFAKTPNLNEHFVAAAFLFSDNTAEELRDSIKQSGARKAREAGLLMSEHYGPTIRNLATSHQVRFVQDHFADTPGGFFYAAVSGKQLGNIDLVYDPSQRDQVLIGQLAFRENRRYFDVWSSFQSRSFRTGARKPDEPPARLKKFQIDATLDPALQMQVTTKVSFTAGRPVKALTWELSRRMRLTSVTLGGEPVELFSRESLRSDLFRGGLSDNALFVTVLPKPLEPGREYTLEFQHEGNVITDAGNDVYYVASRTSWYPNRESAFADYDLTFHHPKALHLVATGEIASDKTEGDVRIVRHVTSSPIRFAGFNLGRYEKIALSRAGISLDVYANKKFEAALAKRQQLIVVPPQLPFPQRGGSPIRRPTEVITVPAPAAASTPASRLQSMANDIAGAIDFMVQHFGPPPLKALTVSPIPGTFGQGFPGLIYLSTLAYLDPKEFPEAIRTDHQQTFYSELLHSHETAHQWWGNLVTTTGFQDDWLMEALASYSALMILERKKGTRALDQVLDEYRTHLLTRNAEGATIESAGPIIWGIRLHSSQAPNAWRTILYEKGSWIIHMIRSRMGDPAFLKMLGELAKRKRYQSVTTEEFRALCAEFMPPKSDDPKLEGMFGQWVYGTGIPTLKLTYKVEGRAPKLRVRGTVTQTGADEDFSTSVPVEIQLPGRQRLTKMIQTSSEPVPFVVEVKQPPLRVALDPGNSVLAQH